LSAFAQRFRQERLRPLTAHMPAIDFAGTRIALFAFLTVASVGAADGGYYATSWGWTAMVLAWIASLTLLGRSLIRISRLEVVVFGAVIAFAAWTALSLEWSESRTQTGLQFERTLVYVAAIGAAIVIVQTTSYRALIGGVWAGITVTCGYGLLTHLFSGLFPLQPTIAGNRLEEPIGYWNSLGLTAAIGCILALGLAVYAQSFVVRAAAAASLVPLSVTLYFTFSRGSWLALGVGIVVLIALDPHRLRLAVGFLAASSWAIAGVLLASRESSLTAVGALGPHAVVQGRHLAGVLVLLAAAAMVCVLPLGRLATQFERPRLERGFSVLVVIVALVAVLGVFAKFGSPITIAKTGWHSFQAAPARDTTSLNTRLFSFSGSDRAELWRVAIHDVKAHPLLGSGAGTYEEVWLADRRITTQVVNAHNLYLETLAELGPVGLAFLLVVLIAPLVAAVRARRRPLVPVAAAAYLAFLVHASVDWDWQIPSVTLAALFTGAAIFAAARPDMRELALGKLGRRTAVTIALTISVVAAIGLLGNRAAASATNNTNHRNWQQADAQAHKAIDWMPWSSIGWERLGDAEYQQGNIAQAHAAYNTAIAKDPGNWQLWLDLALVSTGSAKHAAAVRAHELDPLSPEIACIAQTLNLNISSKLCNA
jgi:hypothetical protein